MTGGSDDARAPHDGRTSVDAAWDELIGESDEDEDSGQPDARPVTGSHAAATSTRRPDADDEMARLMGGETPKLPTLDPESTRIALHDVVEAPIVAREEVEAPKGEREAPAVAPPKTVVEPKVEREAPAVASPKTAVAREEPTVARASRPSLRVIEVAPAPAQAHEADRAARASRPIEAAPAAAELERAAKGGLPWAWIGLGVIALGVAGYLATRDGTPSGGGAKKEPVAAAQVPERTPQVPVPAGSDTSTPSETGASEGEPGTDDGTAESGDTGGTKPSTARTGDPREPPPGTPPEIAAVFRRLPVGPADRPPVGGIGASGIHIDHIAMGSETQGATCRGHADGFSVSGGDRAAVCVRVVHSREKEELQVLWQKHGGSTRRSKMVVLPMHAYRTRGYLVLRNEYIGDWTVRILSSDGVELARHDFTVVP